MFSNIKKHKKVFTNKHKFDVKRGGQQKKLGYKDLGPTMTIGAHMVMTTPRLCCTAPLKDISKLREAQKNRFQFNTSVVESSKYILYT